MYIFDYELALMDTVIGSKSVYNLSKIIEESKTLVDGTTSLIDGSKVLDSLIEDFRLLGADIFVVNDIKDSYGSFNGSISADLGNGRRLYMFSIKVDLNSKFINVLHTLGDLGSYTHRDYDSTSVVKHKSFGDSIESYMSDGSVASSHSGTLGDLVSGSVSGVEGYRNAFGGTSDSKSDEVDGESDAEDDSDLATYSLGVSRVSRRTGESKGGK